MVMQSKYFTHYSYVSGPLGMRVPEDFFDLQAAGVTDRRKLLHDLLNVGRLLARLPKEFNIEPDRDALEEYLNR